MKDDRQKAVEKLVAERLKRELQPGGASCPDVGVIAAYADQALTSAERASFETHAASCRQCQEAVATLARLAESDEPTHLPAPSTRRALAVGRWAWAAPLLLGIVIVGVWRIGGFRSRLAAPQIRQVSPEISSRPSKDQKASSSANVAQSPSTAAPRNAPAAKPLEKQAEAGGPRGDISKKRTAEVKTEPTPPPPPSPTPPLPGAVADNVTPTGGMATPSVRARLAAPAPAPPATAQGTSQGAGGGAALPGGLAGREATQTSPILEQPKPAAVESGEKKTQTGTGTLGKEKRMTTQQAKVTAAPTIALEVTPVNKFQGSDWTVVRTRKAGTWRVGPGGAIQKLGKHSQWAAMASGVTSDLSALAFFDNSEGWIVGQSGTVLHTSDGGKTWTSVTSPTPADLVGVTATAESAAQVTTRDGSVFTTADGGATWNSAAHP